MLRAFRFAWISSIRQPGRTALGILGVAAVGALLFDMLLLSRGLVLSFRDLLDRAGFDVRVLATDATPGAGPLIEGSGVASRVSRLPEVEAVAPVRFQDADLVAAAMAGDRPPRVRLLGVDPHAEPMWTLFAGRDLSSADGVTAAAIVNQRMAGDNRLAPGSSIAVRGECGAEVALPPMTLTVVGIAEFPFDDAHAETVAMRLTDMGGLCAAQQAGVDMLLVRSRAHDGGDAAAAAIRAASPHLHVATNNELVERFSRVEFSYFRQISFVLATITLFFGFLLIAVLLTASVNQRLAEIAALRALGLSRARVTTGVLAESAILVGIGAVLAVPLGLGLSLWLDQILRRLPGIPTHVHFFVFEPRVLWLYAGLLAASAVGAALYPMRIVAQLPIAGTLRREVVG
jgi:ABC-type lipoprotein release transport system permease subunit